MHLYHLLLTSRPPSAHGGDVNICGSVRVPVRVRHPVPEEYISFCSMYEPKVDIQYLSRIHICS